MVAAISSSYSFTTSSYSFSSMDQQPSQLKEQQQRLQGLVHPTPSETQQQAYECRTTCGVAPPASMPGRPLASPFLEAIPASSDGLHDLPSQLLAALAHSRAHITASSSSAGCVATPQHDNEGAEGCDFQHDPNGTAGATTQGGFNDFTVTRALLETTLSAAASEMHQQQGGLYRTVTADSSSLAATSSMQDAAATNDTGTVATQLSSEMDW